MGRNHASARSLRAPTSHAHPWSRSIESLRVERLGGYARCGDNESRWAAFAGDPNYNLLNECCLAINGGNPSATGYTTMAQANMNYITGDGPGRAAFVRYWALMADAIKNHPSAFALELMNEPISINRRCLNRHVIATCD